MKQEKIVRLVDRPGVPSTSIFLEIHTKTGQIGERDVLVCVPGGPGNDHAIYNPPDHSMTQAFFPYVDVVLFDPRSCGRSEKTKIEYSSLDHYIDDIEAIRKYLKISREKLVILGQSYGSIAALGYAIKYSDHLKKLILINGAASSEFLKEAQENLSKMGTPEQQQLANKLWTGTFTGAPEENDAFFQVMTPLYQLTFKPGMPTPPLTYNVDVLNFGFGTFLKRFDFRPGLRKVTCKTLILWGEDDWIADPHQAKIIHQGIAGSVLKVYSHCGHLLWLDQWERFLSDVKDFLES